jgi:hypothetical protein
MELMTGNAMDNFQVSHRYKVNCSNVLGMIATGDGGLLLCDYSEKKGGVVVYGENGKYIKKVTLKDAIYWCDVVTPYR